MLVAVGIGWGGITSIIGALNGHEIPRPDVWTIVVAGVSIAAKEFCYRYTMVYARKIGSSALKANAWHHRTDAISSVATIIGVSLAYALGDSWRIMDPIASIVIAVFIGISAIQIAKPSIGELLEVSLPIAQINNINNIIRSVNGVRRVHNLRARRNGHAIIVDVNVHVDPDITIREGHAIATDVEEGLRESYGHNIIIYVHVEPDEGHPEC